jgi:hypothetical protein
MESSIILLLLFFAFSFSSFAQPDGQVSPFGSRGRAKEQRGAFLWHSETANTSARKSGNLSLVGASRYGVTSTLELSTHLAFDYWIPNISMKKIWRRDDWVVSSRHALASATPGIQWARGQRHFDLVADEPVPFILSSTNELLVSRPFIDRQGCNVPQPWLILSASASFSFGVPFGGYEGREMQAHFLANRSEAWIGQGFYGCLKARADWQMLPQAILRGGFRYYAGSFSGTHAVELDASLEYFLLSRLSVSGGCMFSLASYDGLNRVGFLPFVDLSWYFGRHEDLQTGLFETDVIKSISRKKRRSFF